MRQSFYEFCCVNGKQQLLAEWDDARNLPLTPQTVTYGSRIAAWWRCRYGHSWSAAIYTRSEGAACPYCAGRRVLREMRDLETLPIINAGQTPEDKDYFELELRAAGLYGLFGEDPVCAAAEQLRRERIYLK